MIKNAGIEAGLAFSPATDIQTVAPILAECDFILLMRIEPGYAGFSNRELSWMQEKIRNARKTLDAIRPGIGLEIDGRVSFADAPELIRSGATSLVCGSRCAFVSRDYKANYQKMVDILQAEDCLI